MEKINLLLSKNNITSFYGPHIREITKDYFNFLFIDENPTFNKSNTLIVAGPMGDTQWYLPLHQEGYKVLVDQLWGQWKIELPNSLLLHVDNWFWYHDSVLYKSRNYHNYIPNKTYKKLALMPLGAQRLERDMLYNKVAGLLDDFVWSYVGLLNKLLPDDSSAGWNDVFYFNPAWYDDTYFSLISETSFRRLDGPNNFVPNLLLSEKTFKAMAFRHPFVVWGQPGVLNRLHELGFETYDNLFDESYDTEKDQDIRLDKIFKNVLNFNKVPYDNLTLDKMQHNYELFFNTDLVMSKFTAEIINPIIHFFETN